MKTLVIFSVLVLQTLCIFSQEYIKTKEGIWLQISGKGKEKGVVTKIKSSEKEENKNKTKTIIPLAYKEISFVGDSLILAKDKERLLCAFSSNGEKLFGNDRYIEIVPITEHQLFLVRTINNKWKLIQKNGSNVLPSSYKYITIHGDVVVCESDWYTTLFTTNGEKIDKVIYVEVANNLLYLYKSASVSVLNQKGEYVIEPNKFYEISLQSQNGFFKTEKEITVMCKNNNDNTTAKRIRVKKMAVGIVDKNGNTIIPTIYKDVKFENGSWWVKTYKKSENKPKWTKFDNKLLGC